MKKNIIITLIVWGSFLALLNAIRTEKINNKITYLMNEGYSYKASEHIAKVQLGIIRADKEYKDLMED